MPDTIGHQIVRQWMLHRGMEPFSFQTDTWEAYLQDRSGLVLAPTGFGKTFALFPAAVIHWINQDPDSWQTRRQNGLQLLWITPLKALAKDLHRALQVACSELTIPWEVALRTGDTSQKERASQRRNLPEILITTPESLHLLLASKGYPTLLEKLQAVVVDEWHELLGSKRGVQVELALSRLRAISPGMRSWGMSATVGNPKLATQALVGMSDSNPVQIRATGIRKSLMVQSIIPDSIERYPWAGHLGLKLIEHLGPVLEQHNSVLIFTNTRRQAELWYHALLDQFPSLAGLIALHHSAIDAGMREWVEDALHRGTLKAVVCTSSLDLGVDFRPVDAVVQIGSPKGVSRFLQRAGRSGHAPGQTSLIYFLPTNALELVESAALQDAIKQDIHESRLPPTNPIDVLIQYLVTLAIGEGFQPETIWSEVKTTLSYNHLSKDDWNWCLQFITQGGSALEAYEAFQKVVVDNGIWRVQNRRIALRHRLHIGTIVSEAMLRVRYINGGYIGHAEEYFISSLKPGDIFSLAGRALEFAYIKDMEVFVRRSSSKNMKVPAWMGGRLSMSNNLGDAVRNGLHKAITDPEWCPEASALQPLFKLQSKLSAVPEPNELLLEYLENRDGAHLFIYPLEGRFVHEVLGALLAYRISNITPITFTIAANDYGIGLQTNSKKDLENIVKNHLILRELFSDQQLMIDLHQAINAAEMARRRFRDIAAISGLVFPGFPGKHKSTKHLQASAQLFFGVFGEYDPQNLLLQQAFQEVLDHHVEEHRLRQALLRIQHGKLTLKMCAKATPLCFPLLVDALRAKLSSEKLEDRIQKMLRSLHED